MSTPSVSPPNAQDPVLYGVADGIATIALNRPDVRNAIDEDMSRELMAAFARADDDKAVRCVILTSTHDGVFSAGGNLKGMAAAETIIARHDRNGNFPILLEKIMRLKAPVLCALNGHALAGGLGLVVACDLVIAKQGVRIGTPEINVGLFPFMISALMLRNIPRKRMVELLFLGEQMSAEDAQVLGIVNRVVPAAEFDGAVRDWAQKLAQKSPLMLALGKRALFEQQDLPIMQALGLLQHYLTLAQNTQDIKEGIAAFLEKRPPIWKGA